MKRKRVERHISTKKKEQRNCVERHFSQKNERSAIALHGTIQYEFLRTPGIETVKDKIISFRWSRPMYFTFLLKI